MRLLLFIFAISAVIYKNDCMSTSSSTVTESTASSTSPLSTVTESTASSTSPLSTVTESTASSTSPLSTVTESTASSTSPLSTVTESTVSTPDSSSTTPSDSSSTTPPDSASTTPPDSAVTTTPAGAEVTTPEPTTAEPTESSVYISFMGPNAALNVDASSDAVAMAIRTAVNDYCSMNVGECCADASAMVPMGGVELSTMDTSGPNAAYQATVSFGCSTPLSPTLLDTILSSASAMNAINAALGSTGVTVEDVTETPPNPGLSQMSVMVWAGVGGAVGLLLVILLTCGLAYCARKLNSLPPQGLPPFRYPRPLPMLRSPQPPPFQPRPLPRPPFRRTPFNAFGNFNSGPPRQPFSPRGPY